MILYKFYRLLSFLLTPIARINLWIRVLKNKEDPQRYLEKTGRATFKRPSGKLIWFHAASIGELNSIIPLIKCFTQQGLWVLVTTVTTSSAKVFKDAKLEQTIHQYAPFDAPGYVRKFLKHWKPSLGIFVDSELWPNLVSMGSSDTTLLLVNARLSDRSFKLWQNFPFFAEFIYGKFSHVFAASLDDTRKIAEFYDEARITYLGNLKYVGDNKPIDKDSMASLQKWLKGRKIMLAASTHKGEEDILFATHKRLRKKHPELILIVVPRHHYVGSAIVELAKAAKLKTAQRSLNHFIDAKTDVYIADTLGELPMFYQLADVVFVGGSLVNHGGQNIIEAARLNNPIIVGPYTSNFRQIINEFLLGDAIMVAKNESELSSLVDKLLLDTKFARGMADRALEIAKGKQKILELTFNHVFEFIK